MSRTGNYFELYACNSCVSILVLTTPGSYKSNVAKVLKCVHYSSYVPVGRVRAVQRKMSEQRDVWGQIYRDEYHEEKGVGTVGMDICRSAKTTNNGCQVWFVLGTPWAKSPQDLQGVLKVLSGPSWQNHPSLRAAMGKQYGKLILGYVALLNKNEALSHQVTNSDPIYTMAEILETLMIRRTGDSSWFNRPIINLPKHTKSIIEVPFLDYFRPYLIAMETKSSSCLTKKGQNLSLNAFLRKRTKSKQLQQFQACLGLYMTTRLWI